MAGPMTITGIGAVTGYGWGAASLWSGLLSGKPAAKLVDGFGPTGEENAWLARISDEGDPHDGQSRFARAMRAAAREALTDAADRGWVPGRRVGLLHAVVISEVEGWRDFYLKDAAHRLRIHRSGLGGSSAASRPIKSSCCSESVTRSAQ